MDIELFERLLYEEEGPTLDFKREQYRFAGAPEEEKAELLKDILGFANAWRRAHAFILVGVEEVRGGRSNVLGIPASDQLDDHSLQQFVNSRTNRPIRFRYQAFCYDDKQVGVIEIEEQQRPIFLTKNYGFLERERVYVRRGSSTDPTKPATPDEVSSMGKDNSSPIAELLVEFVELNRDVSLGNAIRWEGERCEMPPEDSIPDYGISGDHPLFGGHFRVPVTGLQKEENADFHRELAAYIRGRRILTSVRVAIRNVGQVFAERVRIELSAPVSHDVLVVESHSMPTAPKKKVSLFDRMPLSHNRTPFNRSPGDVDIESDSELTRIIIDGGDIQPGRSVLSETFGIGRMSTGEVVFGGVAFAANLPRPLKFNLTTAITVAQTSMTVDELLAFADRKRR